jgi:dolichol kinase
MSEFRHVMPFLIPMVAIIMGIGVGMLALWLDHQKKIHIFELHHKERLMAIERGMEVPPLPAEFFQGRAKAETSLLSNLRWGLIWLLLGLAIAAAIILNGDSARAAWGLIPIAIGLAQLIFYSIGRRQEHGVNDAGPLQRRGSS